MIAAIAKSRQFMIIASSLVVLVIFISYLRLPNKPDAFSQVQTDLSSIITQSRTEQRKIWQTAKTNAIALDQQSQDNIQRWTTTNPEWRYELITDHGMDTYVLETFPNRKDITDVFTNLGDSILRADFLRYLVLLGHGGVYSDLDTECLKPIDAWIPERYSKHQDLAVLGIEYDTFGLGHVGALLDLQLINWTLMSRRAGHPLFDRVARNVAQGLTNLAANQSVPLSGIKASFNDVLATTGPAALTMATWEYLSEQMGREVTWEDMTKITEPLLLHDVLILPVTAWGNGQSHSNAGSPEDEGALVHHQFKGGWKVGDHSWANMKGSEG